MYYFRYEMKLEMIPYVQEDIKNFLTAFETVLNDNSPLKTNYFQALKKKIQSIDLFYDRNYHDFRAHLIFRSKKLLNQFWKSNINKLEVVTNSLVIQKPEVHSNNKIIEDKTVQQKFQQRKAVGKVKMEKIKTQKMEIGHEGLKKRQQKNQTSSVKKLETSGFKKPLKTETSIDKNPINVRLLKVQTQKQLEKQKNTKTVNVDKNISNTNNIHGKETKTKINQIKPVKKMSKDQYIKYLITKTV